MSRSLALVATVAVVAASSTALAGGCRGGGGGHWRPAPQPWRPAPPAPAVVQPIRWNPNPAPVVQPRQWYFGMSLQLTQTAYGRGLQVASITPGGPAHRAGLEAGDVLLTAAQTNLGNAFSNEHGVQLLNQAVSGGGAPAPAAAAAAVGFVQPASGGSVMLTVVNHRTNQPVYITVAPQRVGAPNPGIGLPAPAAQASPVASAPAATAF